jgi:NitT/TauT family transport system permease protein
MASGQDSSVVRPAAVARDQDAPATSRAAPSNWLASITTSLPAVIFLALLIVGWEAYVTIFRVNDFILPAPSKILAVSIRLFPLLLAHTWTTTYEILLGFLLGNGFAVLMALLIVNSRIAERVFYPLIIASQTIPKVAIAPLFLIWLGSGLQPKILIAAIVCFFPTVVNTVQGLRATDPNAIDLLRLVAASRRQVFLKLQFPNALPYFFAGLKISIALAVIGAIIGEWVGANSGLGYLIMFSSQTMRTDLMFAALGFTALLGMLLYLAVVGVERLLSWTPSDMPVGGL